MNKKKNIDHLFQEKFDNFELNPRPELWHKIATAKNNKQKRYVIPFWWKLGGVAAVLMALLGIATFFTPNSTTEFQPQLTQSQKESNPSKTIHKSNSPFHQNTNQNNNTQIEAVVAKNSTAKTTKKSALQTPPLFTKLKQPVTNSKNSIATVIDTNNKKNNQENTLKSQNKSKPNPLPKITEPANPFQDTNHLNSVVTTVNTPNQKKETSTKKDLNKVAQAIQNKKEDPIENTDNPLPSPETIQNSKWAIAALAAPVYYGNNGGSSINESFANNTKSGAINSSYGIQVAYNVTNKLKLKTGINNVNLSYNTNGVAFTPTTNAPQIAGIDYGETAQLVSIIDNNSNKDPIQVRGAINEFSAAAQTTIETGALVQRLDYFEIPLEAAYTIVDNALNISIVGGISTLFLNNDSIELQSSNGTRTPIGKSTTANNVSFTTNIGVGVQYNISKKIAVNLDPTVKYQLNGFSASGANFKPYVVGLYSGIQYRF